MSPQAGGLAAKPAFTVAEVLRVGLPDYAREHPMPPQHWRVLRAILACRTPALGGHVYRCRHCATPQFVPHSCRNRHCPTCQGANGYAWLEAQKATLLPIPYFHVVFTLPHALNPLIQQNPASCYDLLFAAAAATLLTFGERELHAQLGVTVRAACGLEQGGAGCATLVHQAISPLATLAPMSSDIPPSVQ